MHSELTKRGFPINSKLLSFGKCFSASKVSFNAANPLKERSMDKS